MNRKTNKIQFFWSALCFGAITILLFFWLWTVFKGQQRMLCSDVFVLFQHAMYQEKEQQIERWIQNYNPGDSPNDISKSEKDEWCAQDYLTFCDPDRSHLDSLFQISLMENGIKAQSAVRYVCKGDTIYTSPDTLFYRNALALDPIIYRIDTNKDNNIMLQAYVEFPFKFVLTRSPLFFIILSLWLLSLVGVIGGYYIIERKRERVSAANTVQESIVPLVQEQTINWIALPSDLLFDEKCGELKYKGEICARLTDNSLRLFRSFIKAEQYKLTYQDIALTVLGRLIKDEPTKSDKDAVANTIYRLRNVLKTIPVIEIGTIRSVGYQMIFSANVSSSS